MCVICISPKGQRQPTRHEIQLMWNANTHGAGYMVAREDCVEIHKGFMVFDDFIREIKSQNFTDEDVVVYHFRISTQGGVNPEMTQPFPYSNQAKDMKILDCTCSLGIAHNGIIPLTSTRGATYSDTALFILDYMPTFIRDDADLDNEKTLELIEEVIHSKMVFLTPGGNFYTIGNFTTQDGLLFSNMYWYKVTTLFREKDYFH